MHPHCGDQNSKELLRIPHTNLSETREIISDIIFVLSTAYTDYETISKHGIVNAHLF